MNSNGNPSPYLVLLIQEDPQEFKVYAEWIRGVAQCQIDVLSHSADFQEWLNRTNYHLVVIDSAARALSLLEQIKRLSPSTSVIWTAKNASVQEAVSAIRLGAEDYLAKPFQAEEFQLAVKRGLDKKAVFGANRGVGEILHLLNSCQLISASLELKKILEVVQSYLARELGSGYSAIYTLSETGEPIWVDSLSGTESQDRVFQEILGIALKANRSLESWKSRGELYRFVPRAELTPSHFVFQFQGTGQTNYFCACLSPETPVSIEGFEGRLRLLKAQIEVTGKNIERYHGVEKLAYLDDVTGLYNTRYLNQMLDKEIARSRQTKEPFAILFIDVDQFKKINDVHGHLIGTRLLNELGNYLKKFAREQDTVFRYGGDEFVAILSGSNLAYADALAERIRESVKKKTFLKTDAMKLHVTVSIGVALFPDHASSKKEIIEAADRAMYQAKKKGGDHL